MTFSGKPYRYSMWIDGKSVEAQSGQRFTRESPIDNAFQISRDVRAGTIWVNTFMDGYPELLFGGYKESGLGRELGRFAIDEFTELKTVQLHLGPRTNWWHRPA